MLPIASNKESALAFQHRPQLISALAPSCFGRNPNVRRLFPDYRAAEEDYYRRTRIFPIMHVVGIRKTLLEKYPWLAVNTYLAFLEAKRLCYRDMEKIGHVFTTLPWPVDASQDVLAEPPGDLARGGHGAVVVDRPVHPDSIYDQGRRPYTFSAGSRRYMTVGNGRRR